MKHISPRVACRQKSFRDPLLPSAGLDSEILTESRYRQVKISDEPGKSMGEDLAYLRQLATIYGIDPATVQVAGSQA